MAGDSYLIAREQPALDAAFRAARARIVAGLADAGVDHVVGVPDNQSRLVYELLERRDGMRVVPVCREGEAFALASGLFAGGAMPAVMIQNTGLLEAGDSLRGTARAMGIPLVSLVGYRGYRSLGSAQADSVATVTEPTLRAWDVPYRLVAEGEEGAGLAWAFQLARQGPRPTVVLLP